MPTRGVQWPAEIRLKTIGGSTTIQTKPNVIGYVQSISSFNDDGTFVPGKIRMNPVVLRKTTTESIPAPFKVVPTYWNWPNRMIGGDLAAYAAQFSTKCSDLGAQISWDETMAKYALHKAYAKASEPVFDIGVTLGELRETVAGIAKPLSALREYVYFFNRNIRSLRGGTSSTLNMLTGSWLEWRYGIKPLISTIQDAIELFNKQKRRLNRRILRAKGVVKKKSSFSIAPYVGQVGVGEFVLKLDGQITVETSTTAKLYYKLDFPPMWHEKYGLDLSNLPSIAWELVPLSFVVDWFIGVGNWLGRMRFDSNRSVLANCISQKTVVTLDAQCMFNTSTGAVASTGSKIISVCSDLTRNVNQTPALLPALNSSALSLQRQIDGVSLIWQRMPKLRR